ncbi:MAG: protease modulator HflC [Polyangiaceae bacterium]|nr:protease modulator HflC [Polyangiaceae bacterium]
MSKKTWLLVVAFVGLGLAASSFFAVDEREFALVTQFGEYKRSIMRPGPYFKLPLMQEVHKMDSRIQGSDTAPAEYLTLDKKRLVADPVTRWRIANPLRFFTSVRDQGGAKARLDDIINSELRRELATRQFGDIIGSAREPLLQRVAANVREQTRKFGIQIIDLRIKRADLPNEVEESVFARMRAERERVAKQYRSEGEEEAAKIRADTDKEKAIILAKAYQVAQESRGQGDADSTKIYADAFGKDPEFYAFVRSLDAYEQALGAQSTLVLSTGSDLFQYLADPTKKR